MIGYLRGKVLKTYNDSVLIDVSGIGYLVTTTVLLATKLKPKTEIELWTIMIVSEREIKLIGFDSEKMLNLFSTLIKVNGIGPKIGLAICNALSAEEIVGHIANGEAEAFRRISGIGAKNANRLIIELQNHFAPNTKINLTTTDAVSNSKLSAALKKLGYTASEIASVVSTTDPDLPLEKQIKAALAKL